jgi:hypothetical protein
MVVEPKRAIQGIPAPQNQLMKVGQTRGHLHIVNMWRFAGGPFLGQEVGTTPDRALLVGSSRRRLGGADCTPYLANPADGPTFGVLGRPNRGDRAAVLARRYFDHRSLPASSIGPRFAATNPTSACDEARAAGPGGPSLSAAHIGDAPAQAGTSLKDTALKISRGRSAGAYDCCHNPTLP